MIVWILLPLLFFSVSHSKLIPYIFPIFPPLAILLGNTLAEYWEGKRPLLPLRAAALLVVLLFSALLIGLDILPTLPGKIGAKLAVLSAVTPLMLSPLIAVLALLAYLAVRKHSAPVLILGLAFFGGMTGLTVNALAARLDPSGIKPLALSLKEQLKPDDVVVAYRSYWQDVPVYLNRNVTVAGWTGELEFGVTHYPHTRAWMIDNAEFLNRCETETHDMYVFMREDAFNTIALPEHCRLHMIGQLGNTILLKKDAP